MRDKKIWKQTECDVIRYADMNHLILVNCDQIYCYWMQMVHTHDIKMQNRIVPDFASSWWNDIGLKAAIQCVHYESDFLGG